MIANTQPIMSPTGPPGSPRLVDAEIHDTMIANEPPSTSPNGPPGSPRLEDEETHKTDSKQEKNHQAELVYRSKVVEINLGNIQHEPIRRGSTPTSTLTPHRFYGHLHTLKNRSRSQMSNPSVKYDYVQEDIINIRRSSSPQSYNSTTRVKQLPAATQKPSSVPFPRVGSARGVRTVPVCTERYLGTDNSSKKHLRSKSMEHIRQSRPHTEQVKRFEDEQRNLHRTRTLKKTYEVYSHRTDHQYFMSGSGLGLGSKYHIDDREYERLKEFSRARHAQRLGSASSQRMRGRERIATRNNGAFLTQTNMGHSRTPDIGPDGLPTNSIGAQSESGKTIQTRTSSALTDRTNKEHVSGEAGHGQDVDGGRVDKDAAGKRDSAGEEGITGEDGIRVIGINGDVKDSGDTSDNHTTTNGHIRDKNDHSNTTDGQDTNDHMKNSDDHTSITNGHNTTSNDHIKIPNDHNGTAGNGVSDTATGQRTSSNNADHPGSAGNHGDNNNGDAVSNANLTGVVASETGSVEDDGASTEDGSSIGVSKDTGSNEHDGKDGETYTEDGKRIGGGGGGGGGNSLVAVGVGVDGGGGGVGVEGGVDGGGGDGNGNPLVGASEETDVDGKRNEENEDGEPDPVDPNVLQISLTAGITLISKLTSKPRNKKDVYNINFEDPDPFNEGFRFDAEAMQRERSELQSRQDDVEDDDDLDNVEGDGDRSQVDAATLEHESQRYPLNTKDSEIARMEAKLGRVSLLEADIASVGHLTDSRESFAQSRIDEEKSEKEAATRASDTGVFSHVKNDKEMKEADERREADEKRKEKRYRTPYKPKPSVTMNTNKDNQQETKKPYRFQLTDMYNFINARQRAIFEEKFEELDKNHEEKVTLKELTKQMKKSDVPKTEIVKFMQVFDLNNDKTIDKREFVTVAALNDKLTGHVTQSAQEPLQLDIDTLSFNIQAYKDVNGLEHTTVEDLEGDD